MADDNDKKPQGTPEPAPTPSPAPAPSPGTSPDVTPDKDDKRGGQPVPLTPDAPPADENMSVSERVAMLEFQTAKKEALDQAQKDYPDVPREILAFANNDLELKEIADKYQANIKIERNKAIEEKQKAGSVPRLTTEQASEQFESLKGSGKLEDYVALKARQAQVTLN